MSAQMYSSKTKTEPRIIYIYIYIYMNIIAIINQFSHPNVVCHICFIVNNICYWTTSKYKFIILFSSCGVRVRYMQTIWRCDRINKFLVRQNRYKSLHFSGNLKYVRYLKLLIIDQLHINTVIQNTIYKYWNTYFALLQYKWKVIFRVIKFLNYFYV